MGIPEGKRSLGRLRLMREGNIKTDLSEIVSSCMEWIDLAWNGNQ
jgi:hypothetical protein